MRQLLLIAFFVSVTYGCIELSGKEPHLGKGAAAISAQDGLPEELRVGKAEAAAMRSRRKSDDAAVKISASDLLSLMRGSASPNDSFIFYFVKYDVNSEQERSRYAIKGRGADWYSIAKKPSSLLVGFIGSGQNKQAMYLSPRRDIASVPVYDLSVVCPPPPDCNCEIAQ